MSAPRFRTLLLSVALVALFGLILWFGLVAHGFAAGRQQVVYKEEATMVSWLHQLEGGGIIRVTVRQIDYPTVAAYREAIDWHLAQFPPNVEEPPA